MVGSWVDFKQFFKISYAGQVTFACGFWMFLVVLINVWGFN
jgi:hypothetical protein